MKTPSLILFAALLCASLSGGSPANMAQGDQLEVALQAAMKKESVDGDLKGAIEAYKKIAQSRNRAVTAKALVRMGQCYEKLGDAESRKAYERVLREHPGDPAGASALYGLGRLQADPAGGLRNYRAAQRAFSRLLADYPESRWEAEARTWQAVLGDLLAREAEAARLKEEAARLKEEAVRLRTQIERLRRTDLDLERRR